MPQLELTNFDYRALRSAEGLEALDGRFQQTLAAADPALAQRLRDYRADRWRDDADHREFLIRLALAVQAFLIPMFEVSEPVAAHRSAARRQQVLMRFRRRVGIRHHRALG